MPWRRYIAATIETTKTMRFLASKESSASIFMVLLQSCSRFPRLDFGAPTMRAFYSPDISKLLFSDVEKSTLKCFISWQLSLIPAMQASF